MWVPLHVHSQYSVLDASASVKKIAERAALEGMPAVALTDHGNLFGAVDFYRACLDAKVQPLIGCEFYVAPRSRLEKKKERGERVAHHLTCLAMNQVGYQNLCRLTSLGYTEGFYYYPRVDHPLLERHSDGLICLSGCMNSPLSQAILQKNQIETNRLIDWYMRVFSDRFYIELQRHTMSDVQIQGDGMHKEAWLLQNYQDYIEKQARLNKQLVEIATNYKIPMVATNDSHYIDRDDWRAHEILLNVQSGEPCEILETDSQGLPTFRRPNPKRRVYPSHEVYFKSGDEMSELFSDLPEAISTTAEVASRCRVTMDFQTKNYPIFSPPSLAGKERSESEREKEVEKFLWELCQKGVPERYTADRLQRVSEVYPGQDPIEIVNNRLQMEMEIIASKGLCDYLLIVWDFINWAKNQGIPVGPGRGSGVGSIVLYLIGITDIEPLRFHLFFERFINPERLSYPDIDVDICMERRGEVIQYTLEKYGAENVAQIITFGKMKAKMVVRDVGRVLSVPLSKVNLIAKLIPDDLSITLESALEKDPDFRAMYEGDEETRRVVDLGKKIEGAIRSTGIHAAGVIISGQPLTEFIPICNAKDSDIPVTQYSMKPVQQVGMLKMDFLGLKTLTAIQVCVEAVARDQQEKIDWVNLPLEDEATFNLLNQGKTLGVFQLESGGMQDLARGLHLDKFQEIVAVGALYRPGPMDMIPSFINRKHGREAIEYDHPWMEEILAETYGIMVYQEQVMQIAQKLAGYSLGEGDVLRSAMGKKDRKQMGQEREKFKSGAMKNGISESLSTEIFDKMEKFASYGFNKSHAAGYGYLSYVTAYLKANYPKEWMAALMTCDFKDITKLAKFIREAHSMQIAILPPDVNESGREFRSTVKGIRFAMSGIKGVGIGVVDAIVRERDQNGPFSTYYDFFKRINPKRVGKKMIENLVDAGAFDYTKWSRDALRQSLETMYEAAIRERKEKKAGVQDLFSHIGQGCEVRFAKPPKVKQPTSKIDRLLREKELLGFFLTGHPMDQYAEILKRLACVPLKKIEAPNAPTVFRSAVIIESVKIRFSSKKKKKFAILTVGDGTVSYELPVWSDLFEEKHQLLKENQLIYAVLQTEKEDDMIRLSCRWLDDLTQATDEMVSSCDQVYDRIKKQLARGPFRQKKSKEKQESPMSTQLKLQMDSNLLKMSHLLVLKKVLEAQKGSVPLQLVFLHEGGQIGTVHVGSSFFVRDKESLVAALADHKIFTIKSES